MLKWQSVNRKLQVTGYGFFAVSIENRKIITVYC
jgi:hypothetical protein